MSGQRGRKKYYSVPEILEMLTSDSGAAKFPVDSESEDEDLIRAEPEQELDREEDAYLALDMREEDEDEGESDNDDDLSPQSKRRRSTSSTSAHVPQPQPPPPGLTSMPREDNDDDNISGPFSSFSAPTFRSKRRSSTRCTSKPIVQQLSPPPRLMSIPSQPCQSEDEDDEEYTPRPSSRSKRPVKGRREQPSTSSVREEEDTEDRWHNRDEQDERPEPIKFLPVKDPGPTLDPSVSWSPLTLFQLFFSSSVVRTIVSNTNANAQKRLQAGLKFVWRTLTVREFYIVMAIILFSGLVKVHERGDYWRKEWPYNFRFPSDTMARDRFEAILWSLHLSDPAEDEDNNRKKNTAGYDRLFKIKPLYTDIVNACMANFQPYQNIAIDERMVASKARISMRQYMKAKPTKWGYKLFVLADSSTAYTWNFFVYEGKTVQVPGQGLSFTSVMDLMKFSLLGQGYTLFVDNFYSSPALFEELEKHNTGACGTIRKNRIGFPKTNNNDLPKNAQRGDIRWIRNEKLLFVKWMDTREVTVCSTVHEAFSGKTAKRKVKEAGAWQVKNVAIPDAVQSYNQSMGGVDLSDALIGYYSVHHKTMKWYKTFFYHFMDIAVVNSFIIHKELCKKQTDPSKTKPMRQKRFREVLATEMLQFAKAQAQPTAPPASCIPDYYGDDGTTSRRYCKRCQEAGFKKVKTPIYCMRCQVPLCLTPKRNCFLEWHVK